MTIKLKKQQISIEAKLIRLYNDYPLEYDYLNDWLDDLCFYYCNANPVGYRPLEYGLVKLINRTSDLVVDVDKLYRHSFPNEFAAWFTIIINKLRR